MRRSTPKFKSNPHGPCFPNGRATIIRGGGRRYQQAKSKCQWFSAKDGLFWMHVHPKGFSNTKHERQKAAKDAESATSQWLQHYCKYKIVCKQYVSINDLFSRLVLLGTFKDHWPLLMVQSFWTFLIPLLFVHWLFLCRFTALIFVLSEKNCKGNTFCVVNGNKSSHIKSTLQKKQCMNWMIYALQKFFGLHPPP